MGIFDSFLGRLFTKNNAEGSFKIVGCDSGASSAEQINSDLGITRGELEKLMKDNGIIPVNNVLSQAQIDAVYDAYYRSFTSSMAVKDVRRNVKTSAHKQIPVKVQPSQIIREYSSNPVNAQEHYNNKWIRFAGTVLSAERDGQNFTVKITPDDKNFHGIMVCGFVNNAARKVLALRNGMHLTLNGFVHDVRLVYQNDTITVINCSITEPLSPEKTRDVNNTCRENLHKKVSVLPMTNIPNTEIRHSVSTGLNDRVYAESGKTYVLTKFISSGGEGSIYSVNVTGLVAKIYNEKSCTTRLREKIRLMVSNRLGFAGICFPVEVLNNAKGEFIGFIMKEAKGETLTCLKMPQNDFEKAYPSWKKDDLVCLAISILEKIEYLHDHDVLMGDISLENIMFESPRKVYFIDTDSYQYGSYPCGVGTDEFVAPELLGRDLRSIMRTEGNENFAVATLLFMLMMQGKQPYAHQGGSQSASDIKTMIFPYGTGERPVPGNVWELQPIGSYRYIWSHLPFRLKNAFIDTFRKDGKNNSEHTRFSVHDWLVLMYAYHTAMPNMIGNDSMSAELFPTREKYSRNVKYKKCRICGEILPEDLFYDDTTCKFCHHEKENN